MMLYSKRTKMILTVPEPEKQPKTSFTDWLYQKFAKWVISWYRERAENYRQEARENREQAEIYSKYAVDCIKRADEFEHEASKIENELAKG